MRVACVDVLELPLSLLARRHPDWAEGPLAVVEADHPSARIRYVNEAAARARVRPGMRYAAALQLARSLTAAPVAEEELEAAREELKEALGAHGPRVEIDRVHAGVFWLDPSGLAGLYGGLKPWAEALRAAVRARALEASVGVGFTRLTLFAITRVERGVFVLESREDEAERAARIPLVRLIDVAQIRGEAPRELVDSALAHALAQLGVHTIGALLALPRGEVRSRFGPDAGRLHARLSGALQLPFEPEPFEAPLRVEAEIDPPDDDRARLLFCLKGALHTLSRELGERASMMRALRLELELERAAPHRARIEPAGPTRDALSLLELLRLHLERVSLAGPVERLILEVEPVAPEGTQLLLFGGRRRDPEAANRGLARLRAAFGDAAVTRAVLRDAWLPEHAFGWEPITRLHAPEPRPRGGADASLVRRLLPHPTPLPSEANGRPRLDPPLITLAGPYRLQGGFWVQEIGRDYYYAERADGALLWLFRDLRGRRWFLHGIVS